MKEKALHIIAAVRQNTVPIGRVTFLGTYLIFLLLSISNNFLLMEELAICGIIICFILLSTKPNNNNF